MNLYYQDKHVVTAFIFNMFLQTSFFIPSVVKFKKQRCVVIY